MSELKPQEFEIPLTLGMATKPSAELQEPTHMRLVQNLHWRGQGEIEKRPAHYYSHTVAAPSGSAYAVSESCGLITRESDAVLVTGQHGVMTFSEITGTAQWARRSTTGTPDSNLKYCPVSYEVTRRFVDSAQYNTENQGVYRVASAQYNGIHVVATVTLGESANTLRLRAFEVETGKLVATNETATAGVARALHACEYTESGKEGVLVAHISDALTPYDVKTIRYDAASNEFVSDSDLTTNCGTEFFCIVKNGNRLLFAFEDDTTGNMIVQDRTVGAVTTTHTATHGCDRGVHAVVGTGASLIVSCTTTNAYAEVFGTPANAISVFTPSSENFLGISAARETRSGTTNDAVMFVNCVTTSTPTGMRVRAAELNFDATTVVEGNNQFIPHVWQVSNAFSLRGAAHAVLAAFIYSTTYGQDSPAEPSSCFVGRWRSSEGGNPCRVDAVAKLSHDRFFSTTGDNVPSSSYVDTNNNAFVAVTADPSEWATEIQSASLPQTVFLSRISAARPMPMPYEQPMPGVVLVAGAMPWVYDGDSPCEAAALVAPRIKLDVSAGTGFTGTFSLRAMYRRVDKSGNLYRMPGPSVSTGSITNKQIDVYVSICPMASLNGIGDDDLEPELYITENGGSTYYLATGSGLSRPKLVYTEKTLDGLWFKFVIEQVPSTTDPEWPFPATDGPISPEPTPGFLHVAKVVDRCWAIDAEDRTRVWFSKPLVSGFGPEWAVSNTLTIADDCTAVVAQGGGAVVLARGGVYHVTGEGPDALGVGGFDPAVKVADVDCIDPVSVCRTPAGVVFRGRRGFYMLNGIAVQPFGVPIDPEVLTDPTLDPSVSASYRMRVVYQEQTNELHISGVPGNDRLVYNMLEDKWSKYDETSVEVRDLALARGKLWRLERSGSSDLLRDEQLYSRSGTNYNVDATTPIEIETPWYRLDQVSGLVRLWRVWLNLAATAVLANVDTITLSYYVNNGNTVRQSVSWTGAELAADLVYDPSTSDRVMRLPFVPSGDLQVVHSFKFRITCTLSDSTSGVKPLSLRLRFGMRPSLNKRNRLTAKG